MGWDVWRQNELLEKPSGVGPMPFDRTGVRHRLDDLILRRQRRGAPLGLGSHRAECVQPCAPGIAVVAIHIWNAVWPEWAAMAQRRQTTGSAAILELHDRP